jgi:thymidylate synthase ThyX
MKIFLYDEFAPQDNAMLQALYSRSPMSVEEHVGKVKKTGSGNFMEKFYVGYGHHSIADCGSTTMFIEGISILADKAVQDWPLYSGQETSTRYVDMAKQPIINPLGTKKAKAIQDKWMEFYVSSQEEVRQHLREKYPKKPDEDEAVYEKAIVARSFDILRGFLPAGITTQLSWHTNLRQAWDKLSTFRYHPLPEVRQIAQQMHDMLKKKYKHSFAHVLEEGQESYRKFVAEKYSYFFAKKPTVFSFSTTVRNSELDAYAPLLQKRPEKTGLPHFLMDLGLAKFRFLLDYGSFRDIQRHRNGVCRMPLLTIKRGFHKWYLSQLPAETRKKAEELIKDQMRQIRALKAPKEILQYYIAMGFLVDCEVTYGLPATVYVAELRSSRYVHPTLREIAHKMHGTLCKKFPRLKMNCDLEPSDWDVRRGLQDITRKK